jgi:hypothetical protein
MNILKPTWSMWLIEIQNKRIILFRKENYKLAKLIEKKKSQTTYQIELTEDELQAIVAVYGDAHYDYYNEQATKHNYQIMSVGRYLDLFNTLRDDILDSN